MRQHVLPSADWALAFLHWLPTRFRGRNRLARLLLAGLDRARPALCRHRCGALLEVPSTRDAVGWHLLVDRVYEPREQAFMLDSLGPGGWMLDVGANIGAHAVPVAMQKPGCRVLAIEPASFNRAVLLRNVAANGLGNIVVDANATGRVPGEGAVLMGADGQFGGTRVVAAAPEAVEPVAVVPLDATARASGVGRVDVLKVDVEGAEHDVLAGASDIIDANAGIAIVFESMGVQSARGAAGCIAAQQFLLDRGFALARFDADSAHLVAIERPSERCIGTIVASRDRSRVPGGGAVRHSASTKRHA
jgi:FkbM family methyltransferase